MSRVLVLAALRCLALAALTAPTSVGLSVLVSDLVGADEAPAVLALVIGAGSAAAMIANPLFGWLADVTRGPLGRRRPWLVGGAIAGFAGTLAMVFAPGPGWLAASWVVTQAAYNACFGALNGWVSEGLAPALRTRAAGIFSAAAFVGAIPGLVVAAVFASDVKAMLLVMPAIALVVIVAVGLRVPDPQLIRRPEGGRAWVRGIRSIVTPGFAGAWLTRFVFSTALSASLVLALYMFTTRWDVARAEAVRLVALATFVGAVGVVVASLVLTVLARRRSDDRQLLAGALIVLAGGLASAGMSGTLAWFLASTFVSGLAIGTGFTCTRAMVHGLLPHDQSAFGLGVLNIATTSAPIVAPLLASALLAPGGSMGLQDEYAGMLVLLGALSLLGLLALRLVPRVVTAKTPTMAPS